MAMKDPHEFNENVNDASMCVCGIPALTHDLVMDRAAARAEVDELHALEAKRRDWRESLGIEDS